MEDLCSLENSTLKVPYEILNKKFRVAQKNIERNSSITNHICDELTKLLKQDTGVKNETVTALVDQLVDRLTSLKSKMGTSVSDETVATMSLRKRLQHLKVASTSSPGSSTAALEQWKKIRLDRMIIDYLLRVGYYETAEKLVAHVDVHHLTNIHVFAAAKEIEESLLRHETAKALEWCHDNRSKLRRLNSTFELHVKQQVFVELCRQGRQIEAVKYAEAHFGNLSKEQWNAGLTQFMLLFAIREDNTSIAQTRELYSENRWKVLVDEFRKENFRLHHLHFQSAFSACFQTGLSALKTPHCFTKSKEPKGASRPSREKDCPVCVPEASELAENVPYAHASQSHLICSYSGEGLDGSNVPLMLPNGRVYGQNTLVRLASQHPEGQVVCPRTGEEFPLSSAEKVFVM